MATFLCKACGRDVGASTHHRLCQACGDALWDQRKALSEARARASALVAKLKAKFWADVTSGLPCAWCRKPLRRGFVHLDHVVPLCEGGRTTLDNLALSCAECNLKRGRVEKN